MWVHIHILNTVNQNNTKWRKPPECSSMDEWMDHVCLHTECHLAFTSKETLVLAVAYTNLKGMLGEIALKMEKIWTWMLRMFIQQCACGWCHRTVYIKWFRWEVQCLFSHNEWSTDPCYLKKGPPSSRSSGALSVHQGCDKEGKYLFMVPEKETQLRMGKTFL